MSPGSTSLAVELDDVQVESLVPEALRSAGVEQFMARLAEVDAVMEQEGR